MRSKKRILIPILITALIVVLTWRIFFTGKPKFTATGGPLEIKLIAVRPDQETDFYDPEGNRINDFPLEVLPSYPIWSDNQYCLELIFEIPEGEKIELVGNGRHNFTIQLGKDGDYSIAASLENQAFANHAGKNYLLISLLVSDSYMRHSRWKELLRKWFKNSSSTSTRQSVKSFDMRLDYFHVSAAGPAATVRQRREFKNIRASYPDRPKRTHARYLDEMLERLGRKSFGPHDFAGDNYPILVDRDPMPTIKILEIARGKALGNASDALCSRLVDLDKLDTESRHLLHKTLMSKIDSYDRRWVIRLGLKCGIEEYTELAIRVLEGKEKGYFWKMDYSALEGRNVYYIAFGLDVYNVKLNDSQLDRLKKLILDGKAHNAFIKCIGKNAAHSKKAANIIRGFARDDRIWLWWTAVCCDMKNDPGYYISEQVSLKLKKRYMICQKLTGKDVPADVPVDILSLEFAITNSRAFMWVVEGIKNNMTFEQAVERYLFFLRSNKDQMGPRSFRTNYMAFKRVLTALYVIQRQSKRYHAKIPSRMPENPKDFNKLVSDVIAAYEKD